MSIIEQARLQRANILKAIASLNDQDASLTPELLAKMSYDGTLVPVGTRINWNGLIKRSAVDLWDTEANNPDNAPTLWEDILYRSGYRIIPSVITVGTAFSKDECGWWGDILYKSLIDANVYTPEAYPAGWEIVQG